MTEMLLKGQEYDPLLNYSAENYPPVAEQMEFFKHALLEGADVEKGSKLLRGPLYNNFMEVLHETDTRIKNLNSEFTAEYIVPRSYQSREVQIAVGRLERQERRELNEISGAKLEALRAIPRGRAGGVLKSQTLPSGVLDVPYYARQSEDWSNLEGSKGCTNACFRMVFGSITGWTPSQTAVSECLVEQYGTSVVDDSVFSSIYQTEVFQEVCDKGVVTLELIGADFETINTLATRLKQKRPEGEMYCTVNLSSQSAGKSVWHTSVLLGVENGTVTYHDPSNSNGGAYSQTTTSDFLDRWSVAYNRAVITIAV